MGGFREATGRSRWRETKFRIAVSGLTIILTLLVFATQATADDREFEIVVPLTTVVREPQGSEVVLSVTKTPEALVGESCAVTARARNQSSVHPGNDLVVEGASRIVLANVEATPGGVVTASDTVILSEEIVITLIMGEDELFSAGIEVLFRCPPTPTTTTLASTTTTIAVTTISTDVTTTTAGPPTTVTTTGPPTTMAPTTTIEDEVLSTQVLPFTGPTETRLGLVALALGAFGVLLVVSARMSDPLTVSVYFSRNITCAWCGADALFTTPHGKLCFADTRRALHRDSELWMPKRIER